VDASPIILLAKAGYSHLLRDGTERLLIPEAVAEDVHQAGEEDPARQWLETDGEPWVDRARKVAAEVFGVVVPAIQARGVAADHAPIRRQDVGKPDAPAVDDADRRRAVEKIMIGCLAVFSHSTFEIRNSALDARNRRGVVRTIYAVLGGTSRLAPASNRFSTVQIALTE